MPSRKRKRIERRERDSNDRGREQKVGDGDENNSSFTREMYFTRRLSVFHGRSATITSSAHITLNLPGCAF